MISLTQLSEFAQLAQAAYVDLLLTIDQAVVDSLRKDREKPFSGLP